MGGSIAEAVAQQQATMTQSQLDTAAHRESLLLARAKDADDSALEFQRVQQEAKEEKLRSNTRSHCLSGDTAPSVMKTRLDVAELSVQIHIRMELILPKKIMNRRWRSYTRRNR